MTDSDGYLMGRSAQETDRLRLQGDLYAPVTEFLLTQAGIAPGMRVLDVGCGAGDVTLQLGRLVGPSGTVTGVDVDPAVLEVARARAAEAGLATVSFVEAWLPDLPPIEPVDALVGRLILIHQKDPVTTVRELARSVRPGGIVTFQEYVAASMRTVPECPSVTRVLDLIRGSGIAAGVDNDLGDHLHTVFTEAGLTVTGAGTGSPAGTAESVLPAFLAGMARSVLPVIVEHDLATAAEVDVDTLADRIARDLTEAQAMAWPPELAAAWARTAA